MPHKCTESASGLLTCPVCTETLKHGESSLRCPNGHSFDIAREGYVNLLGGKQPLGIIAGDSAEMLAARRSFLGSGYFDPLLNLLADMSVDILDTRPSKPVGQPAALLEVGCGEGFYIGSLSESPRLPEGCAFLGTDVSKAATRLASRRYPGACFFVSDIRDRISVADASISVLLDVFAPRNPSEFARVLEPDGSVLIVIPAPDHLADLRGQLGLLQIEETKEPRILDRFASEFELVERRALEFGLELPEKAVDWLVEMGPNHWHTHEEIPPTGIATSASFIVIHLRRRAAVSDSPITP